DFVKLYLGLTIKFYFMIETIVKNDLPFDSANYQIVEFLDFFQINTQKRAKVKDLGEKVTALHSYFFDYLKEYHIPVAFSNREDKTSIKYIKYENLAFNVKI